MGNHAVDHVQTHIEPQERIRSTTNTIYNQYSHLEPKQSPRTHQSNNVENVMKTRRYAWFLPALLGMIILTSCETQEKAPAEEVATLSAAEEKELLDQAQTLFGVLPASMPGAEEDTPEQIALGDKLFHDTRLSENNSQSCNTCHNVDAGGPGVDNQPTSLGAFGKRGARNSPTVLNAGYQVMQFWDGRAADLVEQAKGPVMNPVEMAMPSEAVVVQRLQDVPEYVAAFKAAFPKERTPVSYTTMARAIAAFERTLISRSRFDEYMEGKQDKLTQVEKRGLKTFIETGCITCHSGPAIGGSTFQKLGLVHPYATTDAGRYDVTKESSDSLIFKVPMLRNIALTAPYFHDGSIKDLHEAVRLMAWHQLDKKLDTTQIHEIVAFLGSLSDPSRKAAAQ